MDPLKIGIVGAGAIAQRNAREALKSGSTEVLGVFDINHKVARDMCKALSVPFVPTYEDMLDNPKIEAVLISTPHFLHKEQACKAAEAGKHILIEKPMANNLEEAGQIISACESNDVKLTVNYSFRYLPKIQKAKELVNAGAVGDIVGVQIISHQFKDPGYWSGARSNSPDDWRASKEKSGGGILIMTTCHAIDYISYICSQKTVRVYSEYDTLNSSAEVEDVISITFRLENGAIGCHSASTIMRGHSQSEEIIWGKKGTMVIGHDFLQLYSMRPIDGRRPGKVYKIKKFPTLSWTAEWVKRFAVAVRENKNPDIGPKAAWENLAFITQAYKSMETGHAIEIPPYEERNQGSAI
jgi:predicted dehydrogenase